MENSQLIRRSVQGDHDAFRQIVERYQNLVCALAFSSCGDVARSEDLAQETFLIAWQRLSDLREPGNLKAWLCGIVRNLARNALRKRDGRASAGSSPADIPAETPSPTLTPHDEAAAREEASLVEHALRALPESYREPLILFYRQDQSIDGVAHALDLSADVVRQRLSRGRKMLRAEFEAVVARSLRNTKPTSALTITIMAAIPSLAAQAQAAGMSAAAMKAIPATKPFWSWGLLSVFASPFISLASIPVFARFARRYGKSPREQQCLARHAWTIGLIVTALAVAISLLTFSPAFMTSHPVWFGVALAASIVMQVTVVSIVSVRADRRLKRIRMEDQQ